MRGSFVKNYAMFTKLCGDDAMKNVVLVTTKWTGIPEELGKSREDELKTEFWKENLDKGAATARFMHTHKSAWAIVDQLVPKERLRALLIQHQLVELKRSLPETAAGKTLRKHLQDALKEYEQTVEQRRKAVVAQKNGLDSPSPESQAEYEAAQKRYEEARTHLQSLLKQIEQLKIPIGKRIRAFFGFI
jgi:exonuclease VII small subunit